MKHSYDSIHFSFNCIRSFSLSLSSLIVWHSTSCAAKVSKDIRYIRKIEEKKSIVTKVNGMWIVRKREREREGTRKRRSWWNRNESIIIAIEKRQCIAKYRNECIIIIELFRFDFWSFFALSDRHEIHNLFSLFS